MPLRLEDIQVKNYTAKGNNPCIVCGRDVVFGRRVLRLKTDGTLALPDEQVPEYQDQGGFPVGNDCAKRPILREYLCE